jgi:hypothetical protein
VTNSSSPRPFWNDGGPLLIVPQAAVALWDGAEAPSAGRVVDAASRWQDAGAPACDYDRACDVDPDSVGALEIGESWGIVLGTAAAQSAQWLPGSDARAFYAVGVEAADDTTPERLRSLASAPGEWRTLRERIAVGPEGLLLAHAASRPREVRELPATTSAEDGAVIGDGLRFRAPAGEYSVSARDVITPAGEYLTFVRFSLVEPVA